MKIEKIKVNNFRNINDFCFDFNFKNTVIIGGNDKTRTNILDAIATGISGLFLGFNDYKPIPIGTKDIYNNDLRDNELTQIECDFEIDNKKLNYKQELKRNNENKELKEYSQKIQKQITNGQYYLLPTVVYYRADRQKIADNKNSSFTPCSRMIGYKNCFKSHRNQILARWFHTLSKAEYFKKETIRILKYFKDTLTFFNLPLDPFYQVDKQTRNCSYLLTIIADLAYRTAILNPQLSESIGLFNLATHGIVLIDAVELHLDLFWQREIMPKLNVYYPNIQFIITTESPLVLSAIKPQIMRLNCDGEQTLIDQPEACFGKNCDRILEDVLNTSSRPQIIKKQLAYLFRLLADQKLTESIAERDKLITLIGEQDEAIIKANILIQRFKLLQKINN